MASKQPDLNFKLFERMLEFLKERISPEDYLTVEGFYTSTAEGWNPEAQDRNGRAMDRSSVVAHRVVREVQAVEAARRECAQHLPDAHLAFDTAGAVYRAALRNMGHDPGVMHDSGYAPVFRMALRRPPGGGAGMAFDGAAARTAETRLERIPGYDRLSRRA